MQKLDYLKSSNADYIDDLFLRYQQDPDSVDPSWRYFFEGLELGTDVPAVTAAPSPATIPAAAPAAGSSVDVNAEIKVVELIQTYRSLGRMMAHIDPLSAPPSAHPALALSKFGLSDADLNKTFIAARLMGLESAKLSDIIQRLRETYCKTIGVEFSHIQDSTEKEWLQKKMESSQNKESLAPDTRKFILDRLTKSESFEKFLHTRYVAQKRFSVEGGESVIPSLDCMIEVGAELGVEQFVLGMAHRGRLNVLTNVFGKQPEYIFTEFEGAYKPDLSKGEGDVKYHMGFSSDFTTRTGKQVHLSLASNPSHLEFINAVIEGVARAKQDSLEDSQGAKVVPIAIHGDAAFAGQGVCYETLNLSQLPGYKTGGTLHIVINNQVGFTTSPSDSRSTTYCTDVAKMLDAPVFHVNGDDPESVWYVSKLCMEYRQKFKKDAFIDLVCYRKHGHNEGDEPSFTQPLLYKKIKAHPTVREIYKDRLIQEKVINPEQAEALVQGEMSRLSEAQAKMKANPPQPYVSALEGRWKSIKRPSSEDLFKPVKTAVSESKIKEISEKINKIPSSFHLHSKLGRFFETRAKAIQEGKGIDWGNGEALAFTTLLDEGIPVRISGQDVGRGTFSHRHSVLHDFETGEKYLPFNSIRDGQAKYHAYNSHLSETGVLGFEYGYALAEPNALVIWEAQFGDFANGAQVIIDQFISTSESKWQRMNGLTLLLPHGFEGQGPEHSSARLERFLQLCGRGNMSVCNLSTPAQIFHALRRQVKRDFRKPLVVMSPKSLLRHPAAVSNLTEFTQGSFEEVLDDSQFSTDKSAAGVRKVLLCSGKVYYDLAAERAEEKIEDVAIVRVEQLYPWPAEKLKNILARYKKAQDIVWVQEEPRNMGAWSYVFGVWAGGLDHFQTQVGGRPIQYVGRDIGASPAVGSHKLHEIEQEELVKKALL